MPQTQTHYNTSNTYQITINGSTNSGNRQNDMKLTTTMPQWQRNITVHMQHHGTIIRDQKVQMLPKTEKQWHQWQCQIFQRGQQHPKGQTILHPIITHRTVPPQQEKTTSIAWQWWQWPLWCQQQKWQQTGYMQHTSFCTKNSHTIVPHITGPTHILVNSSPLTTAPMTISPSTMVHSQPGLHPKAIAPNQVAVTIYWAVTAVINCCCHCRVRPLPPRFHSVLQCCC